MEAQDIESFKRSRPVTFTGGINVGSQFYRAQGIPARSISPMWNLSGNAILNLYGLVDLPFSFTIGRQGANSSFPTFRQMGISPKYKWITVHAGWRNLNFSKYTLNGHTFLGGGLELTPGKLRFSAMAGRLRQAREMETQGDFSGLPPVFRRTVYSFKLGYGTEDNFFDLIYFKAKDDPSSIASINIDSLVTPGENAVFGYNMRFKLGKAVFFNSEAALSLFTRNLLSTDAKELIPSEIGSLAEFRFSSRLNYAAKAGLEIKRTYWNLKVDYERIMPQFESMGSYFFANDVENYTFSPSFRLWNGKVNIYGTFGYQRNNILNDRLETTGRFIGNGGLSFFSGKHFGFQANVTSVNINQTERIQSLSDSIRVAIVNTNYLVTPYWNWVDSLTSKNLQLVVNYQQLNDRNPFTRQFTDMQTYVANGSFTQSFIQTGWNYQIGANYDRIILTDLVNGRFGGTLGGGWNATNGKIGCRSSTTYNRSFVDGLADGSVIQVAFSIEYSPWQKHQISAFTNATFTQSMQFDDFTEYFGGVRYGLQF
jgi:hypothetical protein